MIIEIVKEIHPDDLWLYEAESRYKYKSVRVLSSREWPETGQSAYKVVRSKSEDSSGR